MKRFVSFSVVAAGILTLSIVRAEIDERDVLAVAPLLAVIATRQAQETEEISL